MAGLRNKMWEVETVDDQGNEGLHIVMKKTQEEALAWVHQRAPQDKVVDVKTVLGIELAEIRGERGEMCYYRRYTERVPMQRVIMDLVRDTNLELQKVDQEPEQGFETGAWELALLACRAQLVRSDGSVDRGLKRIGQRSFSKWVDAVERAIEQENPER